MRPDRLRATRRLIFLDETGCNLNLARRYGRAPKGVRLVDRERAAQHAGQPFAGRGDEPRRAC